MNRAIEWFAKNTVAANLLMVLIMVGGLITVFRVKQEIFPEFSLDLISVTVVYLGAAPEEVEEGVCIRIEEEIEGLEGIKKITSTAAEGLGTVLIELELDADVREVLDDVKNRVDAIDTFPEETEKPIISEITNRFQVINVAVWGDAGEASLKAVGERARDEIAALPGITQVSLANTRPYEISIEVSEDVLRRHGLTFQAVADAVRRSSLDLPGGSVKTEGGEILLRTKGQAYRGPEFEELVLLTRSDGTHLELGEVATVVDGFAETDQFTRFDGYPAVVLEVFRTGDQSALAIADQVKEYIATAQASLPEGIRLTIWQDGSKVLRDRIDLLLRNGRNGFILVFIVLALFLRLKLAFWVSVGIPVCFLGVLWLLPGLDVSINLISLFAFVVVLGIVVDDAIIVGENIYTQQTRRRSRLEGSIRGAQEVTLPVIFAVLTSVAAFMPLLNVAGVTGKIMRVIPLIVIPCLLFSLVESLLILPAHLGHGARNSIDAPRRPGPWTRIQGMVTKALEGFVARVYQPSLGWFLKWRYLTVASGVATLILTLGCVGGGWITFVFFPPIEAEYVSAAITLPQGTPVVLTSEAVRALEESAQRLRRDVLQETGEDVFLHVQAAIGEQPYLQQQGQHANGVTSSVSSSHLGEVTIELAPAEDRSISSTELANRWRRMTPTIPDALELGFTASLFSTGEDINVQLTGPKIETLCAAADRLKVRLAEYAGVYEVSDSFREGKKEIELQIKPSAEVLGLTLSDLARQVRQAFYGEEAQRIQRGRDDIRVMVRYPESERRSLGDMEEMRIRTAGGVEVPFSEVSALEMGRGYATITRVDRRRAVNVTAEVNADEAAPGDIIADLQARVLPVILAEFPGVLYTLEGDQAEQRDTMGGLMRGFAIALIMIYALLAVPLKSYIQPLVIMLAIPFGLVGAVWGHMIMGLDLTILSVFGIVALAGVVVNDSLVLVDMVNRRRRSGDDVLDAVRHAGQARFRPILLTSVTTFAGLFPLLMEKSLQAQFLVPMAVSLAYGVMFSTVISLVLIPAGYVIMEDLKRGVVQIVGLYRKNG